MRYILLLGLVLLSLRASAMGMMLSTNENPIQYEDLDIDVQIDSENRLVTMTVQATFSQNWDAFIWLFPLPNAETELSIIPQESENQFYPLEHEWPINLCDHLFYVGNQGSGGNEDSYPAAKDYTRFEDAKSLFQWLADGNYHYPEAAGALIEEYFANGHPIAVLSFEHLSVSGVGHIEAFTVSYSSEDLSVWLPLRLTAFSMGENYQYRMDWVENHDLFPVNITIEADTQYAPANVPHPELDFEDMQAFSPFQLGRHEHPSPFIGLWRKALEENPEGFVTLYAARNEAGRYITKLSAMIAPADFRVDPIFIPAPDLPDFTTVDYSSFDALQFWGCGTARFVSEAVLYDRPYDAPHYMDFILYEDIAPNLPQTRLYFPQFGHSMPYPDNWVHSTIEFPQFIEAYGQDYIFELEIFSPEPVGLETIQAYIAGEQSPPMIVLSSPYVSNRGTDMASRHYAELGAFQHEISRRPDYLFCCEEMVLDLLISEEEWASNAAMYAALLAFPDTYAYRSHAELQHTLFISGFASSAMRVPHFEIGYPAGWLDYYDAESNEIYFLPEGLTDRSQAVTLNFNTENFRLIYGDVSDAELEAYLDEMSLAFNLLPEGRETLRERVLSGACQRYIQPLALEANGRLGFLVTDIVLTAAENTPISDKELRMMAESYQIRNDGCG